MNICSLLEQLGRLYVSVNRVSTRSPKNFSGIFSLASRSFTADTSTSPRTQLVSLCRFAHSVDVPRCRQRTVLRVVVSPGTLVDDRSLRLISTSVASRGVDVKRARGINLIDHSVRPRHHDTTVTSVGLCRHGSTEASETRRSVVTTFDASFDTFRVQRTMRSWHVIASRRSLLRELSSLIRK